MEDSAASIKESFWKELLLLLPFFLLHLNLGVSYCFGSALIEHYKVTYPARAGDDIIVTLLGTLDLIGPIFISTLGGFVQQLVGPKKMLIANGIASVAAWLFIILGTESITCMLLNRLAGGIGIGILMGNVFLPDLANPKFLASFKMIEFVSMQFGCILMFLVLMFFVNIIGIKWVSAIFLAFPAFGLFGIILGNESPVFLAKREMKLEEEKSATEKSSWLSETLQSLKIPICSPSVYKPLILAAALGSLGSIAGDTYITKFLVQILNPEKTVPGEMPTVNLTSLGLPPPSLSSNSSRKMSPEMFTSMLVSSTSTLTSNLTSLNMTTTLVEMASDQAVITYSLIIQCAKLVIVFAMAFLLRRWRVRFLYFLSLVFTVTVLVCLGFASDQEVASNFFSSTSIMYIKTVLLCLHAVVTQLGMQTLPGLLTDVIYPSSCQAVLKGLTVTVECTAFVIIIFVLKFFSYSQAFFIMAGILLLVSPLLYMFVPEVKNMGVAMSAELFVPFQTVFFFVLPENKKGSAEARENARKNWKTGVRKISAMSVWTTKLMKEKETEDFVKKNPKITIDEKIPSIEDLSDGTYRQINSERVTYISNILSQTGHLYQAPSEYRVMVGRGPVKVKGKITKKGSIFLFSDVLIVAKRVLAGRRYFGEVCFKLDTGTLSVERKDAEITFSDDVVKDQLVIQFEDDFLAIVWEKYIKYFQKTAEEKEVSKKSVDGALELMEVRKSSVHSLVGEVREV